MELAFPPSKNSIKCCNCGCSCSFINGPSWTWIRSVKRKYDEFEDGNRFFIPGFEYFSFARVQIDNECDALREMVGTQQKTIEDLLTELEEERNASSSAANEAMSMILRLQGEKAQIQMEARQFKRFAEEQMAHDQDELNALEELLYKRDQTIYSLTCEVQAYKHRMISYGLTEAEAEGDRGGFGRNQRLAENLDSQFGFPAYEYPPLICNSNEGQCPSEAYNEVSEVEKYAFGETPHNHLKNLEYRIHQMERCLSSNQLDADFTGGKNILEKVVVCQSPRWPRHSRKLSTDSLNSLKGMSKEMVPDFSSDSPRLNRSFKKMNYVSQTDDFPNMKKLDDVSEIRDDTCDRVYTIDSIHNGLSNNGVSELKTGGEICEDYMTTLRESFNQPDVGDPYIKKLYMRLQTLEADRESMRQAIISMQTDKVQLVLLKEIAQRLCEQRSTERQMPLKKASLIGSFSFLAIFKWIMSFIFWRKKAPQNKFGLSANHVGLLMLLDKNPRLRLWKCLSGTQL